MKQKNITPAQAYEMLAQKAKSVNRTVGGYAESRGVGRHVPSKWKKKTTGTIRLDMAVKLGII